MTRLTYFCLSFFFFFLLTKVTNSFEFDPGNISHNQFSFTEINVNKLKIADPPYTVFNFATEVVNTHDIIENELQKKEKKAMRRFKYDLDEKIDRSNKILNKILKDSKAFFEKE
ncbi:conserved Plasmodium protein, unknown function [Plasmodium gallinaceum]|uniref:Fam-b protein n=1 Tax=Plasmodium gallinaceum TaxID=5849 RepID=A0A1J1GZX1_PLAGA|nr:conserved Plasmodium protein, unknown function [Plasmodium gallinaceum]CRG97840.1 conserved Plasmodium protein, unknown function [Plasmodium gallinaceum]